MAVDTTFPHIFGQSGDLMREPARAIAKSLLARIEASQYRFGAKLPAERELAEEFGVTRNTVRDALDVLARNQIITRRAGSGTFITYRPGHAQPAPQPAAVTMASAGEVAAETSLLELHVVRGIIEPEMSRLAVINMKPRDIGALGVALQRLEAVQTSAADYARTEGDFLMQIARGTKNPLLIAIYEQIQGVRRQGHWSAHLQRALSPARIRSGQHRLRSLYEAIERRDIEIAVEYMKLQLVDEQRALVGEA